MLKTENSKLVLKGKSFLDESIGMRYLEMFAKEGVRPDRIELLKPLSDTADHLATYNKVDIGLDPFPYNGTTTTCEAEGIWEVEEDEEGTSQGHMADVKFLRRIPCVYYSGAIHFL